MGRCLKLMASRTAHREDLDLQSHDTKIGKGSDIILFAKGLCQAKLMTNLPISFDYVEAAGCRAVGGP